MTDYEREREIFEACLGRSTDERAAFLERAAAGNPSLRERVRRLLEAHEAAAADTHTFGAPASVHPDAPERIGPYRILRELGSGGMGVVYEAEQTEPLVRRVALKIIKLGMDTRQVVARFEAERQALAVMDHPNIAKVLDAGATEGGRPYFVMELVRGVPLLSYCDTHRLGTRERLELFVPLCLAVQHAHQKGVIHRDLKPTNVLVAMQDGKPVPKVIDFGIAKAVAQPLTARTLVTRHGQVVGTAAYMSPEQAEVSALDIDTRSDIYSLGVMLYELLVGSLPVDPDEVGMAAFLSRLARFDLDPPAPSSRLESLGPNRDTVAGSRRTDPLSLKRELEGDLDWVVMKAMEKDRSRRYETADALALDLQRFLKSEPVLARPPSPGYRFARYVKRNRAGVLAAVVALLAALSGVAGVTLGFLRATRAEAEARKEAEHALAAEADANRRLRNSLLAQARAQRQSRLPGRRHASLDLLVQAAAIEPGTDLRDEAISCMMLTDIRLRAEWPRPNPAAFTAFDADLDRYVVGLDEGGLEVRRTSTSEVLQALPGPGARPWVARFSNDGRYLAVKYHGRAQSDSPLLRVWDLETAKPALSRRIPVSAVALDFDPQGRIVAYGTPDRRIILVDVTTDREEMRLQLTDVPVAIRFRPDGGVLAAATAASGIEIRETRGGGLLRRLEHPAPVTSLAWSADSTRLAAGYRDFSALVWDPETGIKRTTLEGHQGEVVDVHMHPKEPIAVTYSWDETSRMWNAATGELLLVTTSRAVATSRDGRKMAFVTGQTMGIWDIQLGDALKTLYGHSGKSPSSVDISPDGRWLASAGGDGVLVWDLRTGQRHAALQPAVVREVLFARDQRTLYACGDEGFLRLAFSPGDGPASRLRGEYMSRRPCLGCAVDPTGQVMGYADRDGLHLFDANDPGRDRTLQGSPSLRQLTVSPGGKWIAAGHWRGDKVRVWNGETGRLELTLLPDYEAVSALFSPDGKWLVTGTSEDYRLFRTGSWEQQARIPRPPRFSNLPGAMGFSDDGSLLAVAIDHSLIQIVVPGSSEVLAQLHTVEPNSFFSFRFSPERDRLAVAVHGNRILMWNLLQIGENLRRLGLDAGSSFLAGVQSGGQ